MNIGRLINKIKITKQLIMIKFIELRSTLNLPTAINVEEIQGLVEDKESTSIFLKGDCVVSAHPITF